MQTQTVFVHVSDIRAQTCSVRDRSLLLVYKTVGGGGGQVKFYTYEKGVRKMF